ncbi:MAG: penicillin acylase family protein [Saprospiraceae bacterium]|nr:penicillin acylase family protein [Saprospiraceae bacterium]
MRLLKFVLLFALTIFLVIIANMHQPFGAPLPPIGHLLNPFSGFWQNAESDQSPDNLQIQNPFLQEEVEVLMDDRLVPHIFAQNISDAYFAQGYVTAMHRLWQMDLSVRAAGGRLAEVVGPRAAKRDQQQRRKGMLMAAQNALESWKRNPEEFALLQAYAKGVNAYINTLAPADYPLGYKLMNFEPEEWTPLHTALFFKSMAETLCFRNYDLRETNARQSFGPELFDYLYPEVNPKQIPIIPLETAFDFDTIPKTSKESALPGNLTQVMPYESLPMSPPSTGSNNWAVNASKTANGNPILCNDPHLNLTLPSIWFEVQLHTPDRNVYGVSLPGIPGVIIGFNENIAWGITNAGHDVLDWYRIDWTDEKKNAYYIDGEVYQVETLVEVIRVRGEESILDTVKYTKWGPVVYEDPTSPYHDLAMRWVAHDVPEERPFYEISTFLQLNAAKNYEDYSEALTGYDSPAQNFVFASKDDDIALKINGRLPIKAQGQGRFIQEGNRSANAWSGFIPKSQIPAALNPEQGYLASANQRSTGPDYPYYYNAGFDDYRGRSINRLLSKMENITVEDMKALQNNSFSILAEEGTLAMLKLLDNTQLTEEEKKWQQELQNWDYVYTADSRAAVVFEDWYDLAYEMTFDEVIALADSMDIKYPESWRFIELLEMDTASTIFDNQQTTTVEDAQDIVTAAFQKALTELKEKLQDPAYDWAKHKGTHIRHLANLPGFSSGELDMGGHAEALNSVKNAHGPSWRMIVELGAEVKALGIYPGGQSGNPGSRFYDNMISDWSKGEYYQLHFLKKPELDQTLYKINFRK